MTPRQRKNEQGGARLQRDGGGASGSRGKKRRGSGAWARLPIEQKVLRIAFLIVTIVAAVIVVGFIIFNLLSAPPDVGNGTTDRLPQTTTVINEKGEEVEVEIPALSGDRKKQFYTVLVIGQDTFGGGNTDTMMLGAYDVPNQKLSVMSLPRDTFVEYRGRNVLLNSVFNRAGGGESGIEALKQEVGQLTGVTPDFYVIVQWEAVGELVDAIGGVEFEVPFAMYYNDLSQGFKIDLKGGLQVLDGTGAMGLLRWRHNSIGDTGKIDYSYGYAEGDIGRIRTQQAFLTATLTKCLQPSVLLPNLLEYINIFVENVDTDLTIPQLAYFAKSAVGRLNMADVEFITMPYKSAGDGAHVLPIGRELLEVVNAHFNPYLEDLRLGELKLVTSIVPLTTPTPPVADTPEPVEPTPPEPDITGAPVPTDPLDPGQPEVPVSTPDGGASSPPAAESPSRPPASPPAQSTPAQSTSTPEPTGVQTPAPPSAEPAPPTPPVPVQPDPPSDIYGPGMEPLE